MSSSQRTELCSIKVGVTIKFFVLSEEAFLAGGAGPILLLIDYFAVVRLFYVRSCFSLLRC